MEIPISYEILMIVPAILYGIFCKFYRFLSLIKDPTCFKNQDLALTNSRYSFQNSYIIEAGLSNFYAMTYSIMDTTFQKMKPMRITEKKFLQN